MDFEHLRISSEASSSTLAAGGNKAETCALCPRPGLRCGNCYQIYYCSKEHQVEHRPIHKANCKPYKVTTNPTLGRHLVATRLIQAKAPILITKPAVVGPGTKRGTGCLGCGKVMAFVGQFLQCSSCGFPMCSKDCEKNPRHASECAAICARGIWQSKEAVVLWGQMWQKGVATAIFALRCLLLQEKERLKILELQSHVEEIRADDCIRFDFEMAITFIRDILGLIEFSSGDIWNMYNIVIINAITVQYPHCNSYSVSALHTSDLTMVESSCLPTATIINESVEGPVKVTLRATQVIQPGEHISIPYFDLCLGTFTRQRAARTRWHFSCVCPRCMDPTELGLYVNSICCSKCRGLGEMKMLLCSNPSEVETAPWKCEECDFTMSSDEFTKLHMDLASFHSHLPDNLKARDAHKTFLEDNLWPRGLLHPMHELIISSKQTIVNYADFEDFPKYMEMLKDLLHFHRKINSYSYRVDEHRMYVTIAEVLNLKREFTLHKMRGNRQKLKEKLYSLEDEMQKPLSCFMPGQSLLMHASLTDCIKRHISEIKQKFL